MVNIVRQKVEGTTKSAFLSDTHFGVHDKTAIALATRFVVDYKPNVIHLVGDIVDFAALSKYRKKPDKTMRLVDEVEQAVEWIAEIRRYLPRVEIHYYEGNHCLRINNYVIDKAVDLYGMKELGIPGLLQFDKFKIHWHGENEIVKFNGLLIEHGHRGPCRNKSAVTAGAMIDSRHVSGLSGHTHRLGTHYRRVSALPDPDLVWMENGCLCRLEQDYKHMADWQNGFTIGIHRKSGSRFHLTQIPIVKGSIYHEGKVYEVKRSRG